MYIYIIYIKIKYICVYIAYIVYIVYYNIIHKGQFIIVCIAPKNGSKESKGKEKAKRYGKRYAKKQRYVFKTNVLKMYVFMCQNIKNNKGEGRGKGKRNDRVQTPIF